MIAEGDGMGLFTDYDETGWRNLIKQAEDERDRLKVCGTCEKFWDDGDEGEGYICEDTKADWVYMRDYQGNPVSGRRVDITDTCHFTPSRWTPYWEEPARKESL
jgi:hypothetical protein